MVPSDNPEGTSKQQKVLLLSYIFRIKSGFCAVHSTIYETEGGPRKLDLPKSRNKSEFLHALAPEVEEVYSDV